MQQTVVNLQKEIAKFFYHVSFAKDEKELNARINVMREVLGYYIEPSAGTNALN